MTLNSNQQEIVRRLRGNKHTAEWMANFTPEEVVPLFHAGTFGKDWREITDPTRAIGRVKWIIEKRVLTIAEIKAGPYAKRKRF